MALYLFANGPMPTSLAQAPVTTGTTIKTLLQIKALTKLVIAAWGVSFDGSAAAVPIRCELLDTGTVFGTVTAAVDADVAKYGGGADQPVVSVAGLTLGTTATGYTCTSEGSITAVKMFDVQLVAPTNQYVREFPLGREPVVIVGNCARIRVTAPVAVNAYAWMLLDI